MELSPNIETVQNFTLTVNDKNYTVETKNVSSKTTLNEYLRDYLHLTGTKSMCREGGCGVCLVAATIKNPYSGVSETLAVNSCLVSILSCPGWVIRTIEGIGSRAEGYDPIQTKIVQYNGTQCGFCTPGMVINMHCLREADKRTKAEIENSFGGNICRCTGYRPILSALKSLASDADEVTEVLADIEELPCNQPKEHCKRDCKTPCLKYEYRNALLFDTQEANWHKAKSVQEIMYIFIAKGNKTYNLVAGNTAKGVFPDMELADYYIDIKDVAELRSVKHDTDKLILGANVTIAEMMCFFENVAKSDQAFKHLEKVVQHLDLVATVGIRNIGTIAGNLTMKYKNRGFQSDIFLLLEGIKAKLHLYNAGNTTIVSPVDYLQHNMSKTLIRFIEIPPLDASYHFESYKIMPRAQNAHAIINAAFLFKINAENIVEEATILYGAINPGFVHAISAEHYIVGKQLFNNTNMQTLFGKLNIELAPDHQLPEPSADFRKRLAIALLYKTILSMAPPSMVSEIYKSGGSKLLRAPVSKGVQDVKISKDMDPIGKSVVKYEAADQAAGEAKYITDMPNLPGQLFVAFVLAKSAAGSTLQRIDASEALATGGVVAFYQATDLDELGAMNNFQPTGEAEWIFCPVGKKLQYYYQPVGIIVATSQLTAEHAADLVEIDYDQADTSPVLTIRDVLNLHDTKRIVHGATVLPKHQVLNMPYRFKGTFDVSWQYHFHMETQVTNIIPEDNGGYQIHAGTQWIDTVQSSIAMAFNIPANRLLVSVKRLGGAFGGKLTRANWVACAAMLAAIKLRRPVKFWLPLTTNMNVIGCRHPTSLDYEVGVDASGKIGFLNNTVYSNMGAHANDPVQPLTIEMMLRTYSPDAQQIDYNWVRTDNHAAAWTRSPGSTEGQAMIEAVIEHIAHRLRKDPADVRLANLNGKQYPLLKKLFQQFIDWADYRKRRAEIDKFNDSNRWRKRGIGLATIAFPLEFLGNYNGLVSIYHVDGSVVITHGGVEIGQGINTKARQVVAYVLGIELEMISVQATNSTTSPNNGMTGGSQTSEAICLGLQKSSAVLKKRIDDAAKEALLPRNAVWLKKVQNAFERGVNLTENSMFSMAKDGSAYTIYGITATEVEVDILTGNIIVQRVDLLEDVGNSISPLIDIGQVEGAYVMGMGFWTSEEVIMDHDGRKMTNRTWNYKPPGCRDIPVDFRVKFPDGMPNTLSPFKTKATAEPPLCMTITVALAIRHAISTARTASDPTAESWAPINGPSTVEWIFLNSLNDYKQYKL